MNYNNIFKKVFMWMFIGLLVTFATGYVVSINENMVSNVASMWVIFAIIEVVLVIVLSARITKMNPATAKILFIIYAFVSGLTFSSIFITYQISSIIFVFLITALVFGVLSLIGYTTTLDLTKFSTYLLVALLGVVICSIINIFVGNGIFEIIICSVSMLVFLGFTVYDVQKIKSLTEYYDEESVAIIGALELYLDFINIFLDILRLFGNGRD